MSINNWFPLEAPAHPNHILRVSYFNMNCARCAWAYVTTVEIYCGHVRWRSFWFSECFVGWQRPSCIAVGGDQQLIRWVVTPPAQHHAGTEHAQHLQADTKGTKEKLLFESFYLFRKYGRKIMCVMKNQELMVSYFLFLVKHPDL